MVPLMVPLMIPLMVPLMVPLMATAEGPENVCLAARKWYN